MEQLTKLNHKLHPLIKLHLIQLVQPADLAWRKKWKILTRLQKLEKSLLKDKQTFLRSDSRTFLQLCEPREFSNTTAKALESVQKDKILSEQLPQPLAQQPDSKDKDNKLKSKS